MYRIQSNGTKYYAVACEHGPYRDVFEAIQEADRLTRIKFGPHGNAVAGVNPSGDPKSASSRPN